MPKKSSSKKNKKTTLTVKKKMSVISDDDEISLWMQFEGNEIIKKGINISVLGKYLVEFTQLVQNIAQFRGHQNYNFPKSCFDMFFSKIKKNSIEIILKNVPKSEHTQLFADNPYDSLFIDLQEILEHIENDTDNSYFKMAYPQPFTRVKILDNIQKLCSINNTSLKITYTPMGSSSIEENLEINFTEMLKSKLLPWIESERRNLPFIDGYFIGYKEDLENSVFWIRDLNDREIICEYNEDIHANLISSIHRYDLCRIFGTYLESPGSKPSIKNLIDILKLDEPENENIEKIINEIINDTDLTKSLEIAEEEVKTGKLITRDELMGGLF